MLRGVVRGMPDRRPRTVRRMFRPPGGTPTDISRRASGLATRTNCLAKRSRGSAGARAVRNSLIFCLLRLWYVSPRFGDPRRRFASPAERLSPYDLTVRDVGIASARVGEVYRDENMGSIRIRFRGTSDARSSVARDTRLRIACASVAQQRH